MNTTISFVSAVVVSFIMVVSVYGGSYTDSHGDGSLSGWTVKGSRTWSESGGYATPNQNNQNSRGYLINNYSCSNNGTFTCKLKGSGDLNSLDGGIVFRFIDTTHYYFVTVAEANASDYSSDNMVRLTKNTLDARTSFVTIKSGLNFSGDSGVYTLKIRLAGSTFTFWLNGDSLGQYIDASNGTGSVGYAYDDLTDPYMSFDSSAWVDASSDYIWDISNSTGIQAGGGTWGGNNYWTTDGTSLGSWPGAGNSATFSGTDGAVADYGITVSGTQYVDSIAFLSSGYWISGGTALNFGTKKGIYVASGKAGVIQMPIAGTSGITKTGSGTLFFGATTTYTGGTTISAGGLSIGYGSTGGALSGDVVANDSLIFNRSDAYTYSGNSSGTGTIYQYGTGTLIFTGTHSVPGVVIGAGTLQLGNGGTTGSFSGWIYNSSALIINRSNSYTYSNAITGTGTLTKSGSGTLILTGSNTGTGTTTITEGTVQIGNNGTSGTIGGNVNNGSGCSLAFYRSDDLSYNYAISGAGSLTKDGAGIVTLTGTNTYTGGTTIAGGTLQIGNNGTSGAITGNVSIGSGCSLVFNRSDDVTYTNVMTGSGAVTKTGAGIVTLTGTNTYTGGTTIAGGTLQIGNNGTSGAITGNVSIGSGCSLVFNRSDAMTYGNVMTGSGSIIKNGAGTLTLSGTNTSTGTIAVNTGMLTVTGSLASGSVVTIGSGAILGGTGTCAGTLNVMNGGTVAPGVTGSGKLSTGTLSLHATSVLAFELGTSSDSIIVNGDLILDGILNVTAVAGFGSGTYHLISYTGAQTDNTLEVGTTPSGWNCTVEHGSGGVSLVVTVGLIQTEPNDTVAVVGHGASFSVTASGAGALTYKWLRYPSDSVGNTATFSLGTATLADTASRFRCVVRDSYGIDSSRWAHLTVIDTPRVKVQPQSISTKVGSGASFSLSVKDTARVTYSWRRLEYYPIELGTEGELQIAEATFNDSGKHYFCLITNDAATTSTDTVELTVTHIPPEITGQPQDQSVTQGDSVRLTVAATGNAAPEYAWRKIGSETILATTASYRIVTAALSDSGRYYCIVSNPGGTVNSDTVQLNVNFPKPVPFFSFSPKSGSVPLTVSFSDASTGEIDSRLWRFGDGTSDTSADPTHEYDDAGLYTIALTVRGPGGTDSLVKKDSLFVYDKGSNPVRLSARHLSGTRVEITISNINDIDTLAPAPACDSMGIWYKPLELPENRDDGSLIVRYKRSLFREATITDTITLPATTDSLFGLMSGLYWHNGTISDFLTGNGCLVQLHDSTAASLKNPFTLIATAMSATSIQLVWNPVIADTVITRARLWYGTSTINTGIFNDYQTFDSVTVNPGDSSMVVTYLTPETVYHFAIQAGTQHEWSAITEPSLTKCTTPAMEENTDAFDSLLIDTLYFDSLSGSLRIAWCLSSTEEPDHFDAGITYSLSRYPASTTGIQVVPLNTRCTDAVVSLNESIRFDTLYYVALWLRKQEGVWQEPSITARMKVHTGHPFRQVVSFFNVDSTTDTVSAFNDRVIIWKDSGYASTFVTTDTLEVVAFTSPPPDMIVVGTPFHFRCGEPDLPFSIGFHLDSLPAGKSINDVRIYRDSGEHFSVDYQTVIDEANSIVSIKTGDIRRRFIAMIDTIKPQITFYSDTGTVISSTKQLSDSIHINDNCANVRWHYLFSKGSETPEEHKRGTIDSSGSAITLIVPDTVQAISSESGLRALLITDDGVHRDTINMSRRVFREESDRLTSKANLWTPVYSTAELFHKACDSLITMLLPSQTDEYDVRHLRLWRWVTCDRNENSTEKWIEYIPDDTDIRSLFRLEPGRIIWLKTREDRPFHLDSAYTLSLKDTFSVQLSARQWTDFGMPFHFGVRMEEILSASGPDADSVLFYRWKQDSASGVFSLEPLFVPAMPDKHDPSQIIEYLPAGGYSFYNRTSSTVTLRIPPTLPAKGKALGKIAAPTDGAWSAKFVAATNNGMVYPAVYLGYSPGMPARTYPLAPSFATIRFMVFDRESSLGYSHYIGADAKNGLTKELLIDNVADSAQTIYYHFEHVGTFPASYYSWCFDAETQQLDTIGTITVAPHTTTSRWMITGDTQYRQRFMASTYSMPRQFLLHALYPNPFRSELTIQYSIPFGAEEYLRIAIYNVQGRRVWEQSINGLLAAGIHRVLWNGYDCWQRPVGSGLYLVRLSVVNRQGRVLRQFDKRATLVR